MVTASPIVGISAGPYLVTRVSPGPLSALTATHELQTPFLSWSTLAMHAGTPVARPHAVLGVTRTIQAGVGTTVTWPRARRMGKNTVRRMPACLYLYFCLFSLETCYILTLLMYSVHLHLQLFGLKGHYLPLPKARCFFVLPTFFLFPFYWQLLLPPRRRKKLKKLQVSAKILVSSFVQMNIAPSKSVLILKLVFIFV